MESICPIKTNLSVGEYKVNGIEFKYSLYTGNILTSP